ncbi:hypothetical protein CPB86DRAFT_623094 [Serendipita vermifera]|nr:hypothetical protein CPB86DRAFT_623094 [Serendipita vermifera]
MYLVRRFREISKTKRKATSIESPHINNIDTDVFGPSSGVYARKVDVRKVPVEIWEEVFTYFAEPQEWVLSLLLEGSRTPRPHMGVVLSHVCRLFRNIALSMPSLWSRLDSSSPIDQFNAFIKRSSQSPLTINCTNGDRFSLPPSHTAAFQSIQDRIVRIETPIYFYDLFRFQFPKFRNLEYLVADGRWYVGEYDLRNTLDGFKELKGLTWYSPVHSPTSTSFRGSARYSLTDLSLEFQLRETFILDLLRCCPFLERVSLQTLGSRETADQEMVPLPRLKSVELSMENYCGWLVKVRGPPLLENFCLRNGSLLYTLTNSSLLPFKVSSLEVHCDIGSYILSWLANEPGILKKLTLSGIPIRKLQDYLFFLKWRGGSMRCTGLEELRFLYKRRGRKRNENDLLEVYSSRCRAGLKPLRVVWGDKLFHPIAVDNNLRHNANSEPYTADQPNPSRVRWISVEWKR